MDIEAEKDTQIHLLPDEIKYSIVFYKKRGDMSDKKIREQIFSEFGRQLGNSTVQSVWKKYQETDEVSNRWSSQGRPRLLNEEEQDKLIEAVKENRLSSSRELKNDLNFKVSRETVNRELLAKGYKAYRAPAKPLLSEANVFKRYQFALKYQSWRGIRWRTVVFSDESAFRLVSPNGRAFVRRTEEERLEADTIQYSSPTSSIVMVWGIISRDGIGPLVRITEQIEAKTYLNFFRYRLWRHYPGLYDGTQIFQADNARPHVAEIVKKWFDKYHIHCMDWPSKSPDLNIIEDIWNKIKFEIRGKIFENQDDLWEEVQYHWNQASLDFINKLYDTLPARIETVLEAEGGVTKY